MIEADQGVHFHSVRYMWTLYAGSTKIQLQPLDETDFRLKVPYYLLYFRVIAMLSGTVLQEIILAQIVADYHDK